jgi:3-deoxy-7-phosphoheptulonate synthase
MSRGAPDGLVVGVEEKIRQHGLEPVRLPGGERIAIGIVSAIPTELREELADAIQMMDGVDHVTHVSRPYKLASREFHEQSTIVRVGATAFGSQALALIGGPCSVESVEQMRAAAKAVKKAGATMLRGGAFKPRTSPYAFQGLAHEGLRIMRDVATEVGLSTVSEVMSPSEVETVAEHVDMLQIGARSMQNFPLLIEAGMSERPVLLKRGPSATIDEFLLAAEYLLTRGNANVVLCERGVHPLDRTYTRNTLDLSAVPVLKEISHLPVIVDPSHGTGHARYVTPMALAGVAAGADGLIVEMHPNPKEALSDAAQALTLEGFATMVKQVAQVAAAVGRTV